MGFNLCFTTHIHRNVWPSGGHVVQLELQVQRLITDGDFREELFVRKLPGHSQVAVYCCWCNTVAKGNENHNCWDHFTVHRRI